MFWKRSRTPSAEAPAPADEARITERDDELHEHGGSSAWRERLLFTFFDEAAGFGGIARVVMSAATAKAEGVLNVFLPDRSMATVLARGPLDRSGSVGRIAFEREAPLGVWRIRCTDTALIFHGIGPGGLPSGRERTGSAGRITLDLTFDPWMKAYGGLERTKTTDEMNFVQVISNGAFEQAGRVHGTIRVGGHQGAVDAGGMRERAWGWGAETRGTEPWWLACAFGPARAVSLHGSSAGAGGWLLLDKDVHEIRSIRLDRESEGRTVRRATVTFGEHEVGVEVRASVPVQAGGGRSQQSVATFTMGERTAWGLAEFGG